ncbi:type II secretion system protein J, partial [Planctomycetota bacterium]
MNQKVSKSARRNRRRGFTLLEILVASIVGAFVAVTATTALRSTMSSRQKIADYTAAAAQLRFAAEMIRKDMINFYRDPDLNNVKLIAYADFSEYGAADDIIFHTANRIKARPQYPEGDVYEVEYGLIFDEENKPYL